MNQGDMNYCKMEVRSYTNIYDRFYTAQILDVQNVTWTLILKENVKKNYWYYDIYVQTCSWRPCFCGNHDKDGISSESFLQSFVLIVIVVSDEENFKV